MFKLGEKLKIQGFGKDPLEGRIGTNLGISQDCGNLKFYMILLDEPTETHLAANVISSCLTNNFKMD